MDIGIERRYNDAQITARYHIVRLKEELSCRTDYSQDL